VIVMLFYLVSKKQRFNVAGGAVSTGKEQGPY